MIDLAILGLLTDQALHGYELKKRLSALLPHRRAVSFGSLYPAITRLQAHGHVKAVAAAPEEVPTPTAGTPTKGPPTTRSRRRPTKPPAGRNRKAYEITATGRNRLVELLAGPDVNDDQEFVLRVAFAGHLAPVARLELFERRRTVLLGRRDELVKRHTNPPRRLRSAYVSALIERDTTAVKTDIAWLDRLIAAERIQANIPQEQP